MQLYLTNLAYSAQGLVLSTTFIVSCRDQYTCTMA